MISLVTRTGRKRQFSTVYQLYGQDLHLTATSLREHFLVAEGAIVDAIVSCQTIVVAFVQALPYAKLVTVVTFRLAELHAGP
jgi:hypothetical protein